MDTGALKRTYLTRRGLVFLIIGTLLAGLILFGIYSLRESIASDYTQRISSIGTRFLAADELYTDSAKTLATRTPVPQEDLDKIRVLYKDVEQDLTDIKGNIFVEKESTDAIDDTLQTINLRYTQIDRMEDINAIMQQESDILQKLKDSDDCLKKIDYKAESGSVASKIDECILKISSIPKQIEELENKKLLECSADTSPRIYIIDLIGMNTSLSKFYSAFHDKDYVLASNMDKQYKDFKEKLNKDTLWNTCFTNNLSTKLKSL